MFNLNRNAIVNGLTHLFLWIIFLFLNTIDPFEREIPKEELWKYKYPLVESYVSAKALFICVFVIPTCVVFLIDVNDVKLAIQSISVTCCLNGIITGMLKTLVGKPRPNFYYSCIPDNHYNDFIHCTGDPRVYMEGRKSFPSGHASFSFASMNFISLYLSSKLEIFGEHRGELWRICLSICPLFLSTLVAVSRLCDYHHHGEDIIAGSALGLTVSYFIYNQYFDE